MTAGQRNAYLAMQEHAHRYSIDDLFVALKQVVIEKGQEHGKESAARMLFDDVAIDIEMQRTRIALTGG